VVPEQVSCRTDPALGKNVAVLTSHGDLFSGSSPVGVHHNLSPRAPTDEWVDWKFPGYANTTCSPFCHVRRVGAAIRTTKQFSNGTFEVRMKPCATFGTASAVFLYNYTEEACGDPNVPNVQNQCSPAYTAQCCIAGNCTINPDGKTGDVCRGVWVRNKEVDIELPSSLETDEHSVDPELISFANARFNSITAFPWDYKHHTKCGIHDPCEEDNYTPLVGHIKQNDGAYHTYRCVRLSGRKKRLKKRNSVRYYVLAGGSLGAMARQYHRTVE
jgi:hypothetical protein